jgi:phosphoribosylformylglycinamidine synthase subunit PurQ / glutaminase
MSGRRPRIAVAVFPGSNDDRDAAEALAELGGEPVLVWHREPQLPDVDAVVLPGGFSYGDYLRCGAIARFAPVMAPVIEFAQRGGLVLGICNGFQILSEAGLLPGALCPNTSLAFVCRDVDLLVERTDTPFTSRCEANQQLTIPVKHGDGCWHPGPDCAPENVVLRYATGQNPNGSAEDVAGVVSASGNVMGLMPHPEHAVEPLLGSTDGALILGSMLDAVHIKALAAA